MTIQILRDGIPVKLRRCHFYRGHRIQHYDLTQQQWTGHMDYRASIDRDFRHIISRQLGRDAATVPGGAILTGLGLDLLGLLELTVAVEDHFGVRINSRGFSGAYTVDVCVNLLERMITECERGMPEPVAAEGAD